jgi:hypothetical protein
VFAVAAVYKEKPTITEKEWEHAGLKCKVTFTRQSHRCGYVTVPKDHIAYGKSYEDLAIDVHGGLTYGDIDSKKPDEQTFGVDCTHFNDLSADDKPGRQGHFWTLEETVAETNRMAEQFQKLTLRAIIEHKLEWMPDWVKDNVQTFVKDETGRATANPK